MILVPDQCVGGVCLRVIDGAHAYVPVAHDCRDSGRIDGKSNAVKTQFVSVHHMGNASTDDRRMLRVPEPVVNLTLAGFAGRNQQIVRKQFRRLYGGVLLRIKPLIIMRIACVLNMRVYRFARGDTKDSIA